MGPIQKPTPDTVLVGLAEFTIVGMGLWQVWFTLCVRLGLSFHQLMWGLFLPIVATIAILFWKDERPESNELPTGEAHRWSWVSLGIAAVASVAWTLDWVPFGVFLAAAVAHGAVLWKGTSANLPKIGRATWWQVGAVVVAMLPAVYATLLLHRPEGDDGFYLGQAVGTVRWGHLPVLGFDAMHGDVTAPVQQVAHKAAGFEVLSSAVSTLFFIHPGDAYYIALPSFFAAMSAVAGYNVGRVLGGPKIGTLAAFGIVAVLLCWAGHYYTYGNFGYVRLFQGKGVLVTTTMPLLLFAALRFLQFRSLRSGVVLALAQAGAAGSTSTALIVAPIAAALAVLPGLTWDKRGAKLAAAGALTAVPTVLMLLLVKLDMTEIGGLAHTGYAKSLEPVLGKNWRATMALMALLSMPNVARVAKVPGADWLSRYVLVSFVLLLNKVTGPFIADHAGELYSWRTYWALPFPVLMGVAGGVGIALAWRHKHMAVRIAGPAGVLLFVAVFMNQGAETYSRVGQKFGAWKVPAMEFETARTLASHTEPDDLVLVTPGIALRLTSFMDAPEMVGVRKTYTRHLKRFYGPQETHDRLRLIEFAKGENDDVWWAMGQIDERCIDGLGLVTSQLRANPKIETRLAERSFVNPRNVGKYSIWVRTEPCVPKPPRPGSDKPKPKKKKKKPKKPKKPSKTQANPAQKGVEKP